MNEHDVAVSTFEGIGGLVGALTGILVPIGFFALTGFIIWLLVRANREKLQARADLYRELLTKFSSGQERGEFLSTEEGRNFLQNFWSTRADPRTRLVKAIGAGLVITFSGVGFLVLTLKEPDLIVPGVLFVALGIGFLVAGGISFRLSKRLDLIDSK